MATNSLPAAVRPEEDPRGDIRNLQQQVTALELESLEQKKPWYKQPSTIISMVAVFISATFSVYTAWTQSGQRKHEEIAKKLETLRATVLQIADLRNEWVQSQVNMDKNSPQFMQREGLINTKKQVLIENADAIIGDVRKYVSPSVFEILAYETQADSKFSDAQTYYELALASEYGSSLSDVQSGNSSWMKKLWVAFGFGNNAGRQAASSGFSKLFIKKDLALLYMQPNTGVDIYNPKRGRDLLKEVIAELDRYKDEYAIQSKAFVLLVWAAAEFDNKNTVAARNLRDQARAEALRLQPWNIHRQQYLENIVQIEQTYVTEGNVAPATSIGLFKSVVLGGWKVFYSKDPSLVGSAFFYLSPETKSMAMAMSVMKDNKLVKKYAGAASMTNPSTIRIDWNGSVSPPSSMGPYVIGTTVMKIGRNGITGTEYTLGDETRTIHLVKSKPEK
jgi:hypothetical protein